MCKKAIYLEDAIEEINKIYDHIKLIREKHPTSPLGEYAMYLDVIEALKSLPSITESERKRGKWIDDCVCSECHWIHENDEGFALITKYNFCPNCGAMMVEGKDDGRSDKQTRSN